MARPKKDKQPPRARDIKVWCTCCNQMIPERTERRHRLGETGLQELLSQVRHSFAKSPFKSQKKASTKAGTTKRKALKVARAVADTGASILQSLSRLLSPPPPVPRQSSSTDLLLPPTVDLPPPTNFDDRLVEHDSLHRDWEMDVDPPSTSTIVDGDVSSPAYYTRPNVDDVIDTIRQGLWACQTRDDDSDEDLGLDTEDSESESDEDEERGLEEAEALMFEDFEREAAAAGKDFCNDDLDMLRAFALKVEDHLTDKTYSKFAYTFQTSNIPSLKDTKTRVEFLSALEPVKYDCCPKSCCCYTGPRSTETVCFHCKTPRNHPNGRPQAQFTYLPIIPRLVAYFKNPRMIDLMSYRSKFVPSTDRMRDIFDSENYSKLKEKNVTIAGKTYTHRFFDDPHDIALGLSTDGFSPFRKRKQTCWPIILFNYNLPPEIRFHLQYIICVGVVPGPKKPKDFDSFLWPLVEEFVKLAIGVPAFDVTTLLGFTFHSYIYLDFGDMPAVAMVMCMKGHNGIYPCRMCMIEAIRLLGSKVHYVPLDRTSHPDILAQQTGGATSQSNAVKVARYEPNALPFRDHQTFLEQANEVRLAPSEAESERRARACGIKGVPLLSYLPSLSFPSSFPFDFMHLIFENVLKNLVLLWTGKYKGLDEGNGSYEFLEGIWEEIGRLTAEAGSTIPSAYGARPQNVADDKVACTADTWCFWLLYIAPILLRGRFRDNGQYYDHFIELVKLVRLCMKFELSRFISKLDVGH